MNTPEAGKKYITKGGDIVTAIDLAPDPLGRHMTRDSAGFFAVHRAEDMTPTTGVLPIPGMWINIDTDGYVDICDYRYDADTYANNDRVLRIHITTDGIVTVTRFDTEGNEL